MEMEMRVFSLPAAMFFRCLSTDRGGNNPLAAQGENVVAPESLVSVLHTYNQQPILPRLVTQLGWQT